jgi:hypothetical protein
MERQRGAVVEEEVLAEGGLDAAGVGALQDSASELGMAGHLALGDAEHVLDGAAMGCAHADAEGREVVLEEVDEVLAAHGQDDVRARGPQDGAGLGKGGVHLLALVVGRGEGQDARRVAARDGGDDLAHQMLLSRSTSVDRDTIAGSLNPSGRDKSRPYRDRALSRRRWPASGLILPYISGGGMRWERQ